MSAEELEHASRLEDLNIQRLDTSTLINPVIVVHAPRETGATTIIGTLLSSLPKVQGIVVLSDRNGSHYMNDALPNQVVFNKPAEKVLRQLLLVQQHFVRNFPDEPLAHIVLALDDIMYTSKLLKSEVFQRDLKIARDFNISIIIATADVQLLPPNLNTFATHVLATKTLNSEDLKVLHKRVFGMFDTAIELANMLALCRPFEFLVGLLRHSGARTYESMTRTFVTKYPIEPLHPEPALVEKLSLALEDTKK